MILDGTSNLGTFNQGLIYVALRFAQFQVVAVLEFDGFHTFGRVDVVHDPTGLVVRIVATAFIQVLTSLDLYALTLLAAILLLDIQGDFGPIWILAHGVETYIRSVEIRLREH